VTFAAGRGDVVPAAVQAACRRIAAQGLLHPAPEVRVRAVALAMKPELALLETVVPLLKDPAAEVRRAALLAVGAERAVVPDDELLAGLHDADAEVQRLCRTALLGRGLTDRQVRMARLLTDPNPSGRLELLLLLRDDEEVDLSVWLRRLSQDPAAAVRAAAARLAGEQQVFQMADRLAQMAEADPDHTVRPIARFHLQLLQPVRPAGGTVP